MEKKKKPFYKKLWFWVIVVVVIGAFGMSGEETPQTDDKTQVEAGATDENSAPVVNVDAEGSKDQTFTEQQPVEEKEPEKEVVDVPTEYKSALKRAKNYSDMMHMSKQGLYDQLTSEYADKFTPEAAQYAIDNLEVDYKENALKSAKKYSDMMYMSKQGLYDQLTSEYGEKFTTEEAQYAVDNLEVDYNENALECAKNYQETMSMSPAAIYDQLVSEYGEKFTVEEAQYAIDNLE